MNHCEVGPAAPSFYLDIRRRDLCIVDCLSVTDRTGLWTVERCAQRAPGCCGYPGSRSMSWTPKCCQDRRRCNHTTTPYSEGQDLALILARSPMLDSSALGNQTVLCAHATTTCF